MSIVKVQSVAPVHFRVGRCHQMKKGHHIRLLSKVYVLIMSLAFSTFPEDWGLPIFISVSDILFLEL